MEHNNITSESEQMYLVAIARLSEMVDECPIPVSKIAEVLDITPISANQMIHQLKEMGLITYAPYKGVEFTETGWQTGIKLLRIRRLWEVFLAEHLHYTPAEVETLACRLEHAVSDETADRLNEFLGRPKVSPQGKPIPQTDMDQQPDSGVPLSNLSAGFSGTVGIILTGEVEKTFLNQVGLSVGSRFEILANQQNGAYLLKNSDDELINLSLELTQKILVKPQNLVGDM